MKYKFNAVCATLVLAAFAAPSFADDRKEPPKPSHPPEISHFDEHSFHTNSVPEINGAGASLALALLGGMVLIARERRKS